MKNLNRRQFLKIFGLGLGTAALSSCGGSQQRTGHGAGGDGAMTMRVNPNTGDSVSILGYGMMRLPMQEDDGSGAVPPIDQDMVNRQVDYALEHGVNYFDTSPAYCQGRSEGATGKALARHDRSKYFIATKLSNFAPETWSAEASREMFENSLRELQTDYVDYLLLHAIGMGGGMEEFYSRYINNGILDWLVEQKAAGRIRNLGFSYHGDVNVFDLALRWHDEGRYHWDFVQIQLNYLDWEHAKEINPRNTDASYLYGELERRGIPAVIMEPLLGGRLAKVPDYIVGRMKAREPEASVPSWAFRFAGTPEGVLTVLSGMTYMEHLQENVATFSPLRPIDSDENSFLMDVAEEIYSLNTIPCNECNYCMPCPYGINIPALFANYNKCINEGNLPHDAGSEDYRRARRAFLISQDRAVERIRQADHCVGCGACLPHCPQRIQIPETLRMIDALTEQLKQS